MQQVQPDLLSRLIVDHVRDGIVLTDADGLTVWINPAFTALSGYEISELSGKKPGQLLQGPNTTKDSIDFLSKAIADQTDCQVDVVNYSKSGVEYIAEIKLSPIFSENGTLTHFVAIQRDVTSERALAQESVDFRAFQRALELQAIVSVADARGRITYVNQKFCQISGYSADELVGKTHRIVNSGTHEHGFSRKCGSRSEVAKPGMARFATARSQAIFIGSTQLLSRFMDRTARHCATFPRDTTLRNACAPRLTLCDKQRRTR